MLSCHCGLDGHRLDCDHYRESTPAGSPALTSGCESSDPSPDCPRCAALTRERDKARANLRKFAAKDIALARDLAQARQERDAFRRAFAVYRSALVSGESESEQMRAAAPEALVESRPEPVEEREEACPRCGSTEYADLDYSGCSDCREPAEALVERGTEQERSKIWEAPEAPIAEVRD